MGLTKDMRAWSSVCRNGFLVKDRKEPIFYFVRFANSRITYSATCRLVSLSDKTSSAVSVLDFPVAALVDSVTTNLPGFDWLLCKSRFDAIADSIACWRVDEVTGFGSSKALESESKSIAPPFFELTMLSSQFI